ncbi:pogo transposable element with KRAB domain-like protein [Aphelenchoides avenae]|nr:pogo transposable element with KRAB domain-like protein [Aphelenchus avenae]
MCTLVKICTYSQKICTTIFRIYFYASFKAKLMQLYNHWIMHGEHEVTAAGKPNTPPPEVCLDWVLEAWYDGVTMENVINSFKLAE